MKSLSQHIEHVRNRPHHIRKQVALGVALGITAVIAIIWLGVNLSTGAFHIAGTSFADATTETQPQLTASNNSLLGAAAAALNGSSSPAELQVVSQGSGEAPTAPAQNPSDQTFIPF